MKIVLAIDSFKGSLASAQAEQAVAEGIRRVYPDAEVVSYPVSDGGEGIVDSLYSCIGGDIVEMYALNPFGEKIKAEYVITGDNTAIIETAKTAGIMLVPKNRLNPLVATTFGVGEMIADAIKKGCRKFILGIGGSATNDCGTGMLTALGFEFYDKDEKAVPQGAIGIKDIATLKRDNVILELAECEFTVACDVINPLCGKNGASYVFAPQKGATSEMCKDMDKWFFDFSNTVRKYYPESNPDFEGSGAAGGMGYALRTFLNAKLKSGIELIIEKIGIEKDIKNADLVITGEGKIDKQTAMGKLPSGIAKIAKKYDKPVIAFSGVTAEDAFECNKNGIDAFFSAISSVCTYEEAMDFETAYKNLANVAEQAMRALKINI